MPSDRTIPPTRPSPRTQALATSDTPCSPASDLRSPPTSSMASRNPTPIASHSCGCTRTLLPPPSPPFPQTGCWESARLRSASERRLPRAHRTTLSQLRSGFSSALRDYRHRIGAEPSPECPECEDPCHSVPHLFSCPARPTDLSLGDMWERPLEVARFLLSVPSFSHLPELPTSPAGVISNNNNHVALGQKHLRTTGVPCGG